MNICSQLEAAAFSKKTIYIQSYKDSNSSITADVIYCASLMAQNIDQFSIQSDESEAAAVQRAIADRAIAEENEAQEFLDSVKGSVSSLFNGKVTHSKNLL